MAQFLPTGDSFDPGLRLISAGRNSVPVKSTWEKFGRRTLGFYSLVLITDGGGWYSSQRVPRRRVERGDLIMGFPGIWHRYGPEAGGSWSEHWVVFDGFIPDRYVRQKAWDPASPVAPMGMAGDLAGRFGAVEEGRLADAPTRASLIYHLLMALHQIPANPATPKDPGDALMERFIIDMRRHLTEPRFDFKSACAGGPFGYSYLRKRFKKSLGISPEAYFKRLKLNGARDALMEPGATVREVAEKWGYYDPFHLSRNFRKAFGLTPREYRRLHGNP